MCSWRNARGSLLLFPALTLALPSQPQAPLGRWEARRPGVLGLGVCLQQGAECGGCVSSQLLPVLLGQVGLHVKEEVLPLLDAGVDLLNQLCLLLTGMALVPVASGVGVGEAGPLLGLE